MEQEHDQPESQYHTLFRQYDAVLGRWWSIDPEQERYASFSPYTAMGANPVNFVDLSGDRYGPTYGHYQINMNYRYRNYSRNYYQPNNSNYRQNYQQQVQQSNRQELVYRRDGLAGSINSPTSTSPNASSSEIVYFGLEILNEIGEAKKIFYNLSFELSVVEGNRFITPKNGDGIPPQFGDDLSDFYAKQRAYEQGMQNAINEALDEFGINNVNEDGSVNLNANNHNAMVKKSAEMGYKLEHGLSPQEKFETWANEQIENGTMIEGETQYDPEIQEYKPQQP
jgi:RHS repeat-associated protein